MNFSKEFSNMVGKHYSFFSQKELLISFRFWLMLFLRIKAYKLFWVVQVFCFTLNYIFSFTWLSILTNFCATVTGFLWPKLLCICSPGLPNVWSRRRWISYFNHYIRCTKKERFFLTLISCVHLYSKSVGVSMVPLELLKYKITPRNTMISPLPYQTGWPSLNKGEWMGGEWYLFVVKLNLCWGSWMQELLSGLIGMMFFYKSSTLGH